MKKQGFSEFVLKHSDHLKDLSKSPWWTFEQGGQKYWVKGFCSSEKSRYSILICNLSRSYFARAGTSQIVKETQEFNPMIQGGVSGVLPLLESCISSFNAEARYSLLKEHRTFEVETVVKGLFQFKWVIALEKQPRSVSKKIVENLILMPLANTVLIQDSSLRLIEESTKRKPEFDIRLTENTNFLLINQTPSEPIMKECYIESIKRVETEKAQAVLKAKEKNEEEKEEEEKKTLKRKPDPPQVEEKKEKPVGTYVESAEETKRKKEIQDRLAKKKTNGKKKLDFI